MIEDALEAGPYYCYILRYPEIPGLWFEPGQPFYVGKGSGDRSRSHIRRKEYMKGNKAVNKEVCCLMSQGLRPVDEIVWEGISEEEAYTWEQFLIKHWGRLDIGTGILFNKCDGGNGGLSVGYKHDERQKATIKASSTDRWRDPEMREKIIRRMREGHAARRGNSPKKDSRLNLHPQAKLIYDSMVRARTSLKIAKSNEGKRWKPSCVKLPITKETAAHYREQLLKGCKTEQDREIVQLHTELLSGTEIGRALNITRSKVCRRLAVISRRAGDVPYNGGRFVEHPDAPSTF